MKIFFFPSFQQMCAKTCSNEIPACSAERLLHCQKINKTPRPPPSSAASPTRKWRKFRIPHRFVIPLCASMYMYLPKQHLSRRRKRHPFGHFGSPLKAIHRIVRLVVAFVLHLAVWCANWNISTISKPSRRRAMVADRICVLVFPAAAMMKNTHPGQERVVAESDDARRT